jgi:hypothetical protein
MTQTESDGSTTVTYSHGIDAPPVASITVVISGEVTPAACPRCNAWQVLDDTRAPLYVLAVKHEENCDAISAS